MALSRAKSHHGIHFGKKLFCAQPKNEIIFVNNTILLYIAAFLFIFGQLFILKSSRIASLGPPPPPGETNLSQINLSKFYFLILFHLISNPLELLSCRFCVLSEDGQFDQVGRKASEHVISDGTLEVEERGPGLPKTQTSFNIIQDLISFLNFFA